MTAGSIKDFDVTLFAFGTAEHGVDFCKGHPPALFADGLGEVLFAFGTEPTVALGSNKQFHFFHLEAGVMGSSPFAAAWRWCILAWAT